MFDIDTKNVKKGKNISYIFGAVGLLFLGVMVWVFISNNNKLKSMDSEVLSEYVDVKTHIDDEGVTMYSPVYHYNVDGKDYACGSNSSSSIDPGTENKKVYYDSKNPSRCMTEYSKSSNNILLIFALIPTICIIIAVANFIKVNKRVKAILELNEKGKLIKNLPYRLEGTGTVVNGVPIQRPVVDYTLPSGTQITLYGDPRNDKQQCDADGMVDLVIDENNPNNYYIDFEINRLSGNLPQDYNQQTVTNPNNYTIEYSNQVPNQANLNVAYASPQPLMNQVDPNAAYVNPQPVANQPDLNSLYNNQQPIENPNNVQ